MALRRGDMTESAEAFISTVTEWLSQSGEVFVEHYMPHSGGGPSWFFVTSRNALERLLAQAQTWPGTMLTVLRERQLPLRGTVDDDFIARAKALVPDGKPYFFSDPSEYPETVLAVALGSGWSHTEMEKELAAFRGQTVWFGLEPDPVVARPPNEAVIYTRP
jgi:hypothetical protein